MSDIREDQRREGLVRELFGPEPDLIETVPGWTSYVNGEGRSEQLTFGQALERMGIGAQAFEIEQAPAQAGSPRYLSLLDEMRDLHIRKNAGYAGIGNPDPWANFRMSESFGVDALRGTLVRLSDKYIRVANLLRNPLNDQVGESLRDTLMDLSAYALISICLLEEQE